MLATTWTRNESEFRKISERLEDFRRRDFSAIKRYIMPVVFPRSYSRRLPADLPLVQAYARELGGHWYADAPTRRFVGVTDEQAENLTAFYARLNVDRVMKTAIEQCMVHHTVIFALIPVPGTTSWTLQTFCPFESEVDPDPVDAQNIHYAKEIRLRVPVAADHRQIVYGEAVYQRHTGRAFYRGTRETGVFTAEGTWPTNGFPVGVMRLADTRKGDFFCPVPTDLYDAQVSMSIGFSDAIHVSRYNSHGQKVAYGVRSTDTAEWEFGPDTIVAPKGELADVKLDILQVQTAIQPYLDSIEQFVKLLVRFNGLNPDIFVKGALTAEAKKLEQNDRERTANDAKTVVIEAERSLFRAIRAALNWDFGFSWNLPLDSDVEVDHKPAIVPENVLQAAQANRLQYEDGTLSPIDVIARTIGKTREEALAIWQRNKAEYAA